MASNKTAFAKRQRETDRKDKARAKEARLAAQRANAGKGAGGPPIDWSAIVEQAADTDTDTNTEGADTNAPSTDAPPRDPAE
jgi:hypothetical protein